MKYLIVDDEHELYKYMFSDLFKTDRYDIEELPRIEGIPSFLKPLFRLHYSEKINRHLWLPGKMIWKHFYTLHKYHFDENEEYTIILLNGSLRNHYSYSYLKKLKLVHRNLKLAIILFDSLGRSSMQRTEQMLPLFNKVFSFDASDCSRYGFSRIFSAYSMPEGMYKDSKMESSVFFIGYGKGRLELLQNTFKRIGTEISGCRFYITGVKNTEKEEIQGVTYNENMSFYQEQLMAYNTDCIVEVLKEGQQGITLRTCEAVLFNKKLLTNNQSIVDMPFYNSEFMSVFAAPEDIDMDFIKEKMEVRYEDKGWFSPLRIIELLENERTRFNG